MGWAVFFGATGLTGVAMYSGARLIARTGRTTLAIVALIVVLALPAAAISDAVHGLVLVLSLAVAVGVEGGLFAYRVRHGSRKQPQQYLS